VLGGSGVVGVRVYAAAARFVAGNELRDSIRTVKSGFREMIGKRLSRSE
jgi:hypothetical protein